MMGSYMNFNNFGDTQQSQSTHSKQAVSTPLVRQSSVYELTFDEFQNTLGGNGKDFGSMNMDEFLKNIWTVEETQGIATSATVVGNNAPRGNLQRQGSFTLPRTISQKTVDEVWREVFKENSGIKDVNLGPNLQQQRQPTLGEVTLEEFLFRAGIVREEAQQMAQVNNNRFYNVGLSEPSNNIVMNDRVLENNTTQITPLQQLPQPLFPKQATVNFTPSMPMANNTLPDPSINKGIFQGSLFSGTKMDGVMVSPAKKLLPDEDTSPVSPPSYMGGGARGRKCGTLEKATERRQKRMIKNRESAARSRDRKQAYTLELEAEIAKLKETNDKLRKKQDEIMEMQKSQASEMTKTPFGNKKRCLRRTLTGPW